MSERTGETYCCFMCKCTFLSDWTDEEAKKAAAEHAQNFPDIPIEECVIICAACHAAAMAGGLQ